MSTEAEKSEATKALNWLLYRWDMEEEFPRPLENETLAQYIIRIQDETLETLAETEKQQTYNDEKEPPDETTKAD